MDLRESTKIASRLNYVCYIYISGYDHSKCIDWHKVWLILISVDRDCENVPLDSKSILTESSVRNFHQARVICPVTDGCTHSPHSYTYVVVFTNRQQVAHSPTVWVVSFNELLRLNTHTLLNLVRGIERYIYYIHVATGCEILKDELLYKRMQNTKQEWLTQPRENAIDVQQSYEQIQWVSW